MRQEERYWNHILAVLIRRGGIAPKADVIDQVAQLANLTSEEMRVRVKSGLRYKKHIEEARQYLANLKLVKSAGRGIWEITEKGRKAYPLSAESHANIKRAGADKWYPQRSKDR